MKEYKLADETPIYAPEEIDCSEQGYFDDLEYETWGLIKKYANKMGIVVGNGPDFATVMGIQDKILEAFEQAGISFRFE